MASSSARSRKVQCNQRAASRSAHGCGRRTHRQSCAGVRAMPSGLHAQAEHTSVGVGGALGDVGSVTDGEGVKRAFLGRRFI